MKKPEEILAQMTLEEKAALCDGKDFWHLKGFENYGVPSIMVCDGPHGLRKKDYDKTGSSLNNSVPSICYPTAAATAASWDPDMIKEMGVALGKKCLKEQVGVLLGPGINMKRSPLCGRNFEYFSEDPVLAGEMAAGLIDGVQSMGVGTSLKHFCVNSQETRRMTVSEVVDERALTILKLIEKAAAGAKENYEYNDADDQPLARAIAGKCMVLLKNEGGILPLAKDKKIAVIGDMAKNPRYQGAGSSQINPTKIDNAFDELQAMGYNVEYAQGYERSIKKEKKNPPLIKAAAELAAKCDIAVVFAGLTDDFESEGFDRQHMRMPDSHNTLIDEVVKANPNTVVVLAGGSPVEMPWNDSVKAILNSYLGGQAGGGAVADILSGAVNPSGKLPETYPIAYEDTPAYNFYPGNPATVEHRESIYIGYRYYEKANKAVRYPFGFGLSYTSFDYSDIALDKSEMDENDKLTVTFKVKNTGDAAGYETAQLYVADKESTIFRPVKELKAFKKVWLESGEEKEITLELCRRAFAFWNVKTNSWCVESGDFDILVGASSADIRLTATVKVNAAAAEIPDYSATAPAYYTGDIQNVSDEQFVAVYGSELPATDYAPDAPITIADSFESAVRTKNGKKMFNLLAKFVPEGFAQAIAFQVPFRDFISMSGGVFSERMAEGLCMLLNGKKGGVRQMISCIPKAIKGVGPLLKQI